MLPEAIGIVSFPTVADTEAVFGFDGTFDKIFWNSCSTAAGICMFVEGMVTIGCWVEAALLRVSPIDLVFITVYVTKTRVNADTAGVTNRTKSSTG